MFEPAKNFMFQAAKKYNLESQALGSLVCEKARYLINNEYSDFTEEWAPQKFEAGKLTIRTKSASGSSALFMQTHQFMEHLNECDLPASVTEIQINKSAR